MINVTVWNEFRFEKIREEVKQCYPEGIHIQLKKMLSANPDFNIRTATLDEPECGLTDEVLESTDVLIWWAHSFSAEVPDSLVDKIHERVMKGMGFIALHSAHVSKPFLRLMGTTGTLKWREGDRERLWVADPSHPIARGVPEHIELDAEEMYGEPFDIPAPDELVFLGWFGGGEVMRSGCCWKRGYGKVFYFQPGHESYPVYYNRDIIKIINNAVCWAYSGVRRSEISCPSAPNLEI